MTDIITWNTRRLYTEHGQRIAAQVVGNTVYFTDVDRCIDGKFPWDPIPGLSTVKDDVTWHYDFNKYEMVDGNDRDIMLALKTAAKEVQ